MRRFAWWEWKKHNKENLFFVWFILFFELKDIKYHWAQSMNKEGMIAVLKHWAYWRIEQNLDRKQRLEALKQRCQEASKELSSLQKPKKRKRTEESMFSKNVIATVFFDIWWMKKLLFVINHSIEHKNTEQETSKPSKVCDSSFA